MKEDFLLVKVGQITRCWIKYHSGVLRYELTEVWSYVPGNILLLLQIRMFPEQVLDVHIYRHVGRYDLDVGNTLPELCIKENINLLVNL